MINREIADMNTSCLETGHGKKPLVPILYLSYSNKATFTQTTLAQNPENHGAMLVPVILGSDKTTVSVATGQNDFWPLYGSIGNIHNGVRRAHGAGLVLIAFLAIAKGISFASILACHEY